MGAVLDAPTSPLDVLTAREHEVLHYLAEGLTNAEMADRLGLSEKGAKWHTGNIYSKLHVRNRVEAAVTYHVWVGTARNPLPLINPEARWT